MDKLAKRKWIASFSALVLTVCAPAFAGEGGKDAKEAGDPFVQLAPVSIPVIQNGRVINYLFLNIKVNLTPKVTESKMRDMEPYFRDAVVRLSYKTSFGQADHFDKLDEPRFKAAMLPEFSKITGSGGIKSIDVVSQNSRHHAH